MDRVYVTYKECTTNWVGRKIPTGKRNTIYMPASKYNNPKAAESVAEINWFPYELDLSNKAQYYHEFDIPKRNGKMRHIKEPLGNMKRAQRHICNAMKYKLHILPSDAAHGFDKGRCCKTAMQVHKEAQSTWFVKFDLHNFFPSCTKDMVMEALHRVAQLGTTMTDSQIAMLADVLTDETGHLTQGCVSSPYIANLILLEFDKMLLCYCKHNHLTYTRYADDLCISGQYKFDWKAISKYIQEWLPEGIYMNFEKTKFTNYKQENIFLGIHYNQDKNLTVGYKTKRLAKVLAHKAKNGELSDDEYKTFKGRLSYYKSIEPEYFSQERFKV